MDGCVCMWVVCCVHVRETGRGVEKKGEFVSDCGVLQQRRWV